MEPKRFYWKCPVKVTRETKQTKFRIPEEVLTYLKEQAEKISAR